VWPAEIERQLNVPFARKRVRHVDAVNHVDSEPVSRGVEGAATIARRCDEQHDTFAIRTVHESLTLSEAPLPDHAAVTEAATDYNK
jgi:hypothetical protein